MRTIRNEPWGKLIYNTARDEFIAEVNSSATLRVSRPLSAGCLITAKCNFRCGFCYGNLESLPQVELTTAEWSRIFHNMHREWGLMRVDLSGGEPTLRSNCGEIAHEAFNAGLNVVLSTNGVIRSKKGLADFPTSTGIHVSIDSGFEQVHQESRLLPIYEPSTHSFQQTINFIKKCLDDGFRVRVLTCLGTHNKFGLFALGELLALLGVSEWNISHVLPAGRALVNFENRWAVPSEDVYEQVTNIRASFPWMTVRYSNRTHQDGYFLLVLPDGSLATQYTDSRDKVVLGSAADMTLFQVQSHPLFNLQKHVRKWIAAELEPQPPYTFN
jgi:MoaA/NifB/PqqE/SkfB family radical SAM enzyme